MDDHVLDTTAERILEDIDGEVRACCDCGGQFTGPGPRCPVCTTAKDAPDGALRHAIRCLVQDVIDNLNLIERAASGEDGADVPTVCATSVSKLLEAMEMMDKLAPTPAELAKWAKVEPKMRNGMPGLLSIIQAHAKGKYGRRFLLAVLRAAEAAISERAGQK